MVTRKKNNKLTTLQAARLLGVSDQSIANWIDAGALRAGKTPGGHRRIEPDDLVQFLKQQNLRVPPELAEYISAGASAPTILIVEDEKDVARWLGKVLRAHFPEHRVLTAHDGFVAGQMVTAERPDLVILDLRLPGVDGFDVCRRIKSDPKTRDILVVAITGAPSPEAEKTILAAGADAFLAKPLEAKVLCEVVRKLIASAR